MPLTTATALIGDRSVSRDLFLHILNDGHVHHGNKLGAEFHLKDKWAREMN
jgi:hypothetical protein